MAQGYDENVTSLELYVPIEDDIITEGGVDIISESGQQMISQNSTSGTAGIFANPNPLVYQPRVDMAISKDAGTTWSNYVSRGLNPIGQRRNIITWNNLGSSNELTLKIRFWGLGSVVCSNGFVELY